VWLLFVSTTIDRCCKLLRRQFTVLINAHHDYVNDDDKCLSASGGISQTRYALGPPKGTAGLRDLSRS